MKVALTTVAILLVAAGLIAGMIVALDRSDATAERKREASLDHAWNGPCADVSWLLATTSGSPDRAACTNKLHKMRVQVATTPTHEEVGALVFCECQTEPVKP